MVILSLTKGQKFSDRIKLLVFYFILFMNDVPKEMCFLPLSSQNIENHSMCPLHGLILSQYFLIQPASPGIYLNNFLIPYLGLIL